MFITFLFYAFITSIIKINVHHRDNNMQVSSLK